MRWGNFSATPVRFHFALALSPPERARRGLLPRCRLPPVLLTCLLKIGPVVAEKLTLRVRIFAWRKRFGGMSVDEAKRLKTLEMENGKLKKMLADRMLEIDVLKEINAKKW